MISSWSEATKGRGIIGDLSRLFKTQFSLKQAQEYSEGHFAPPKFERQTSIGADTAIFGIYCRLEAT